MDLIANFLVLFGALILTFSLFPINSLRRRLPHTKCRTAWMFLSIMVALFFVGYLLYSWLFWGTATSWIALIVPMIFFFGAIFVWVVCTLSAKTANDVTRLCHLEHENVTDPLMGIYNRRYLDRCLRQEAEKSRRYGLDLSILLIDVDHFKTVNDTYGHLVGDQVLHSIAQLIDGSVRDFDRVFRYGGEELVVLLPYTTSDGAIILAERLCDWIAERRLCEADPSLQVTVSIGVSSYAPVTEDVGMMMARADEAMYRAKNNGRNRVESAIDLKNGQGCADVAV